MITIKLTRADLDAIIDALEQRKNDRRVTTDYGAARMAHQKLRPLWMWPKHALDPNKKPGVIIVEEGRD
jgi:hypothetical protein